MAMMERVKKQVEVQEQLEALKKKYGNQSAIGDIEKMDVDQRQKLLKEAQKKEKEKKEEKVCWPTAYQLNYHQSRKNMTPTPFLP
jgi:hypothetical protein